MHPDVEHAVRQLAGAGLVALGEPRTTSVAISRSTASRRLGMSR